MPRYFLHLKSALQSIDDACGLTLGSDGLAICLGFILAKALAEDDRAWRDFVVVVTDTHENALARIAVEDVAGGNDRIASRLSN
jgi:hypothetical protein